MRDMRRLVRCRQSFDQGGMRGVEPPADDDGEGSPDPDWALPVTISGFFRTGSGRPWLTGLTAGGPRPVPRDAPSA